MTTIPEYSILQSVRLYMNFLCPARVVSSASFSSVNSTLPGSLPPGIIWIIATPKTDSILISVVGEVDFQKKYLQTSCKILPTIIWKASSKSETTTANFAVSHQILFETILEHLGFHNCINDVQPNKYILWATTHVLLFLELVCRTHVASSFCLNIFLCNSLEAWYCHWSNDKPENIYSSVSIVLLLPHVIN